MICLEREIVLIFVVSSLYYCCTLPHWPNSFILVLEPHSFISSRWEHPFSFSSFNIHGVENIGLIIWFGRIASHFVHAGRERSLEKEASAAAGVLTGH